MKYLQTRVLGNRRKKSLDWTRGGQSSEELSGGTHSKKRSSQGRGQIHNLGEVRLGEQKSTNSTNKKTELDSDRRGSAQSICVEGGFRTMARP